MPFLNSSIIIVCIVFVPLLTHAQKQFKTHGKAQVKIEDNYTKETTKQKAKELAIINAIENVLGSYVEQETTIKIEEGNTNFKIVGNTKVKGDWLKTSSEAYEEHRVASKNKVGKGNINEIWITCTIKGVVREIIKPALHFEAITLNCPQKICRTTTYYNNEQFYLNFSTPSDGYLSVYIVEEDNVYRLLPYAEMPANYVDAIQVKADKSYLLFSPSENHDYFHDFSPNQVDEIVMTTDVAKEYADLYVVFSTSPFAKPILSDGVKLQSGSLPKSLSKNKFEKWIADNRIYNASFNYEIIPLEILNK